MYLLMYNNVDEYLKQKRTEKFTEEYIKKAKLLINEGLYHVVYSPDMCNLLNIHLKNMMQLLVQ